MKNVKKSSVFERMAAVPHVVWTVLFIAAPLLFVVYFAFTDRFGSFTLENIQSLSQYSGTFVMSLGFSLIATTVCLLIGYPLAYCMSKTSPKTRNILVVLMMLPTWISLLIRTYSLMALLDNGGIVSGFLVKLGFEKLTFIGTEGAVILGMVYDFLPYMVMPIYNSVVKLDKRYIEAAHDLGCNGAQTLIKVILPLTVPGIVSGVTMVFVPSISTFYISQKLGGTDTVLIGDVIERLFKQGNNANLGAALSLVLMILVFVCTGIMNRFGGDEEGGVVV